LAADIVAQRCQRDLVATHGGRAFEGLDDEMEEDTVLQVVMLKGLLRLRAAEERHYAAWRWRQPGPGAALTAEFTACPRLVLEGVISAGVHQQQLQPRLAALQLLVDLLQGQQVLLG